MVAKNYLLGCDIGSSSVKATLLDIDTGLASSTAFSPESEMKIDSPQKGQAEQDPATWWHHLGLAVQSAMEKAGASSHQVEAIGITYQMHGLVLVDKAQNVLRPSIIWCDSRASGIGEQAFKDLGQEWCLSNLLNSPGNFTASKLKWVQENEPQLFKRIYKMMLPGDYIAMRLTGEISTTETGLSEGIFWNFKTNSIDPDLLNYYGLSNSLLPGYKESFEEHGKLTSEAAETLGLRKGIPVTYKAGDQPNNAFSLNVLNPGEIAATAGTSGVIYGISDKPTFDNKSRVNTFVHVNHENRSPRYGVLLCINGTGILNSWLRKILGLKLDLNYDEMNELANQAPVGSDGLTILPFGNGNERILENRDFGGRITNLNFNRHDASHILRAAQEGIVFSLYYGFQIMEKMGMEMDTVKAGYANMFLSPLFRDAFVNTTGVNLELYNTDGSQGAARGAGVGAGIFGTTDRAFKGLKVIERAEPVSEKRKLYLEAYQLWLNELELKSIKSN
jgi:xylulokinase